MLGIIMVILALMGLITIYYLRFEETKRKERVKMSINLEPTTTSSKVGNHKEKKKVDFKSINEAYNKADLYFAKKDFDNAQKHFVYVLSLNPDHIEANNKLGLIHLQKNMPKSAETVFRQLVDIEPKNAVFWGNLALSVYVQGQLEEARRCYEISIRLDNAKEARFISLGQICVELKDWKAAINAYSKAIVINPKNFDTYFTVANLLIKIAAFDEAIAFLESILEVQPYNKEAKELIRETRILKGASPLHNKSLKKKDKSQVKKKQQALF